jgi:hypothetical protein
MTNDHERVIDKFLQEVYYRISQQGFSNKREKTFPRQAVFACMVLENTKPEDSILGHDNFPIVCVARNSYATTYAEKSIYPRGCTLHAEWNLMRILGFKPTSDTVYIARIRRDMRIAPLHSCAVCMTMLGNCGVKKVVQTYEYLHQR